MSFILEPVCCKKQQKKVPDHLLVFGIGDLWRTWMIPNWLHTSSSDFPVHPGSILYNLQIRGPLLHKPVTGQELFFCFFLQQTGSSKVSSLQFGDCAAADKIDPMMIWPTFRSVIHPCKYHFQWERVISIMTWFQFQCSVQFTYMYCGCHIGDKAFLN